MANQAHGHTDITDTHAAHNQPGPRRYITIGLILLVVTLIEIGASYLHRSFGVPLVAQIALLVALAIVKGLLVVMFFMHLRFDSRWFTFLFTAGIILATFGIITFLVLFAYRAGQVD